MSNQKTDLDNYRTNYANSFHKNGNAIDMHSVLCFVWFTIVENLWQRNCNRSWASTVNATASCFVWPPPAVSWSQNRDHKHSWSSLISGPSTPATNNCQNCIDNSGQTQKGGFNLEQLHSIYKIQFVCFLPCSPEIVDAYRPTIRTKTYHCT